MKAGLRISMGSDNMSDLFNPLGSGNMLNYAQLLAYVQRFYEASEQQALLDMLMIKPVDENSAYLLSQLETRVIYETGQANQLLTHASRPSSITTFSLH